MKKTKYDTVRKNKLLSQYVNDTDGNTGFAPAENFVEHFPKKDSKQK